MVHRRLLLLLLLLVKKEGRREIRKTRTETEGGFGRGGSRLGGRKEGRKAGGRGIGVAVSLDQGREGAAGAWVRGRGEEKWEGI